MHLSPNSKSDLNYSDKLSMSFYSNCLKEELPVRYGRHRNAWKSSNTDESPHCRSQRRQNNRFISLKLIIISFWTICCLSKNSWSGCPQQWWGNWCAQCCPKIRTILYNNWLVGHFFEFLIYSIESFYIISIEIGLIVGSWSVLLGVIWLGYCIFVMWICLQGK